MPSGAFHHSALNLANGGFLRPKATLPVGEGLRGEPGLDTGREWRPAAQDLVPGSLSERLDPAGQERGSGGVAGTVPEPGHAPPAAVAVLLDGPAGVERHRALVIEAGRIGAGGGERVKVEMPNGHRLWFYRSELEPWAL